MRIYLQQRNNNINKQVKDILGLEHVQELVKRDQTGKTENIDLVQGKVKQTDNPHDVNL